MQILTWVYYGLCEKKSKKNLIWKPRDCRVILESTCFLRKSIEKRASNRKLFSLVRKIFSLVGKIFVLH